MAAAISWAKEEWARHVSLMYADIEIPAEKHQELLPVVKEAGIWLGKERLLTGEKSTWNRIALVEIWKQLKDWNVVASRAILVMKLGETSRTLNT